jgi:hypothetical protein
MTILGPLVIKNPRLESRFLWCFIEIDKAGISSIKTAPFNQDKMPDLSDFESVNPETELSKFQVMEVTPRRDPKSSDGIGLDARSSQPQAQIYVVHNHQLYSFTPESSTLGRHIKYGECLKYDPLEQAWQPTTDIKRHALKPSDNSGKIIDLKDDDYTAYDAALVNLVKTQYLATQLPTLQSLHPSWDALAMSLFVAETQQYASRFYPTLDANLFARSRVVPLLMKIKQATRTHRNYLMVLSALVTNHYEHVNLDDLFSENPQLIQSLNTTRSESSFAEFSECLSTLLLQETLSSCQKLAYLVRGSVPQFIIVALQAKLDNELGNDFVSFPLLDLIMTLPDEQQDALLRQIPHSKIPRPEITDLSRYPQLNDERSLRLVSFYYGGIDSIATLRQAILSNPGLINAPEIALKIQELVRDAQGLYELFSEDTFLNDDNTRPRLLELIQPRITVLIPNLNALDNSRCSLRLISEIISIYPENHLLQLTSNCIPIDPISWPVISPNNYRRLERFITCWDPNKTLDSIDLKQAINLLPYSPHLNWESPYTLVSLKRTLLTATSCGEIAPSQVQAVFALVDHFERVQALQANPIGRALLSQMHRLQQGSQRSLPYWFDSQIKLNALTTLINRLDVTNEVTLTRSLFDKAHGELHHALSAHRLPLFSKFGHPTTSKVEISLVYVTTKLTALNCDTPLIATLLREIQQLESSAKSYWPWYALSQKKLSVILDALIELIDTPESLSEERLRQSITTEQAPLRLALNHRFFSFRTKSSVLVAMENAATPVNGL